MGIPLIKLTYDGNFAVCEGFLFHSSCPPQPTPGTLVLIFTGQPEAASEIWGCPGQTRMNGLSTHAVLILQTIQQLRRAVSPQHDTG